MSDNENSENNLNEEEHEQNQNEDEENVENEDQELNEQNEQNENQEMGNSEENEINDEEVEIDENQSNEEEEEKALEDENNKGYYNVYAWLDTFKFRKAKKNLTKDFSDGSNFAELLFKLTSPHPIIELHNICETFKKHQKYENWKTIQKKLHDKTYLKITDIQINGIIECKPYAIEDLLEKLYSYCYQQKTFLKDSKKEGNRVKNYMKNINSK